MSKITQALEKAARERLMRQREQQPPMADVPPPVIKVREAAMSTVTPKIDPHIIPFSNRRSAIAEQYRMLRTNLQSLKAAQGFRTILVTSAHHDEGKSVTALNLALTLAQQPDCNVLLIDADLRKGAIQHWLGFEPHTGLSQALANGIAPQEALVKLEAINLTLLPAGKLVTEPSEWLDSMKMRDLVQYFKRQFDYVLVDSPPLLLVSDPSVLSRYVDGVLLVVRAGRTQRRALLEAQNRLLQVKGRIIGTVLTHAGPDNPAYYNYHRSIEQGQANGKEVSAAIH